MPDPTDRFHPGDPETPAGRLTDADHRLLRNLHALSFEERAHATNDDLGMLIAATGRTARKALTVLDRGGHIRVVRVTPHPVHHRTGRFIYLPGETDR